MRKMRMLAVILCFLCTGALGQRIQYSRHLVKTAEANGRQLVTDIGGHHHIISFNRGKKPVVDIFDRQLKYISRKEVDIVPHQKSRVSLLKFTNHYLLYFHVPGSAAHRFVKVQGDGLVTDISASVNSSHTSLLNKSSVSFQMVNQDDRLLLITNTYLDSLKTIVCTILRFNESYAATNSTNVAVPYDADKENLRQLAMYNNELVILKEKRSANGENLLELSKIDLESKKMTAKEFSSGGNPFFTSSFRINTEDSTILLSSILPRSSGQNNTRYTIFISRLGFGLQELAPPVVLRSELGDDISMNMLLVKNSSAGWVPFYNKYTQQQVTRPEPLLGYLGNDLYSSSYTSFNPVPSIYYNPLAIPTSLPVTTASITQKVKLTLLDTQLRVIKYRQLKPYKGDYPVPGKHFAGFSFSKMSYMMIAQNYLRKQNGLAIVHTNPKNEIVITDTRASAEYEYYLNLISVTDDGYVILPYSDKNEMGLVKIHIKSCINEND